MSIASGLKGFFEKSEAKVGELLPTSSLFSNHILVLIGFVVLMIVARSFLTEQIVTSLTWLVGAYLFKDMITGGLRVYWNGRIRVRELELSFADGKLDDNEEKLLGMEPKATATVSVSA